MLHRKDMWNHCHMFPCLLQYHSACQFIHSKSLNLLNLFQVGKWVTQFWVSRRSCAKGEQGRCPPSSDKTGHMIGQREKDAPPGQRLWYYLGWYSLAFPQGAGSGLRIDVDWEKVTLISQCPSETSNPVHTAPPALWVNREQTGDSFWWLWDFGWF